MADERINAEASVKFFVGVSSAGIGFIFTATTFLQQHGFFQQPVQRGPGGMPQPPQHILEVLFGFTSLVLFVISVSAGGIFYVCGTSKNYMGRAGAEERLYKLAERCAFFGFLGLWFMSIAALVLLGSQLLSWWSGPLLHWLHAPK
jgi:hypothetical protein